MGENVNAFKALYVAFGGKLTDYYSDICNGAPVSQYSLTSDVVYALAKLAPGIAAKELPDVTSGNSGEVLTVNAQGKWVSAAIPSQLPAVTAEDNGSVLKVSDGAWGVGTDLIEA